MTVRCQAETLSVNRPILELTLSAMPIVGVQTISIIHRNRLPFAPADHIEGRVAADAHKWHKIAVKRGADVILKSNDSLQFTIRVLNTIATEA